MRWGIAFKVPSSFESDLWGLPPPSQIRRLQSGSDTKKLEILYHFLYNPQSWEEWQRVAAIKIQMKERMPNIEFVDYEVPKDIDGKMYTIKEIGGHFRGFVKFPKVCIQTAKEKHIRGFVYTQKGFIMNANFILSS